LIAPRWQKVFKDLTHNKTRTILVALSIAIGVCAAGFVSSSFLTMLPDMDADYLSVNPHAAVISADPFGDDEVAVIRRIPGVAAAEGRSLLSLRILSQKGAWKPVDFSRLDGLDERTIDRLRSSDERPLPALDDDEVYIEQSGRLSLAVDVGDFVQVELAGRHIRRLRVAGIVHDVTILSSVFSGRINAYVAPETFERLGGASTYSSLVLTVPAPQANLKTIQAIAGQAAARLEKGGHEVQAVTVPTPGENPVSGMTRTLLMMIASLGGLAVVLSAFLVVNTISALMAQHVRQIGIMKAIGGQSDQIAWMYVALVCVAGLAALLVAIPLAAGLNALVCSFMATMLNFKPGPLRIPPLTVAIQTGTALVVPACASLAPVLDGVRLTVREAISSSYGMGNVISAGGGFAWMEVVPRPLLISLRNIFRRKKRMALTLATLTLGGAIFMAVFNIQAALNQRVDEVLGYFLSDVNLTLGEPYRKERIEQTAYAIPGVTHVESWSAVAARALAENGGATVDVVVWGPPPGSHLIRPVITQGRWLLPEDENALVVGNHFLKKRPDVQVGDDLTLRIDGKDYRWRVVGVFLIAAELQTPFVYANQTYLGRISGGTGQAASFRLVTRHSGAAFQSQVAGELERRLSGQGVRVAEISTGSEVTARQSGTVAILVNLLMIMAVLIALVGGIGLMGTMSMNVLERTREIGVMRSIGASNLAVLGIVLAEGLAVGVLGWLLGVLLSVPLSFGLDVLVGLAFTQTALPYIFSPQGMWYWLAGSLTLAAFASLLPAVNAMRLTIRDGLVYE